MKILENGFGIANEILEMINEAENYFYLISPYILFEKKGVEGLKLIKDSIAKSLERNVKVNIFVRPIKNPIRLLQLRNFYEKGCEIKFLANLNSKIYSSESKTLITSMNLYVNSVFNNEEIGLLIDKESEVHEFTNLFRYIKKIEQKAVSIEYLLSLDDIFEDLQEIDQKKTTKITTTINDQQNYIYVLKLEKNKWWVGKTKNPSSRIAAHKDGRGSSWTRDYKVINTEEIIENGDLTETTLNYMEKYGWENVRGTCFNEMYEKYIPKKIREFVIKKKNEIN